MSGSALERALAATSAERAAALTLDLVRIPSPTGDTAEVAERFAGELRRIGMDVELFAELPRTPVVIGRLPGEGDGPTLVLNGHLDTVPVPHAPPERRDGWVYGRGAADMKGPLAAAVEALRAARDGDLAFRGDVILCAHGLHEAPGGRAEDLILALQRGKIRGDAAIVLELGHDALPIVQMGMGIFHARFLREGDVTHELRTPEGTPNPAHAAAEAVLALRELDAAVRRQRIPHAGPESLFLGQVHCGDFYNRFPNEAWLEGTRRYDPASCAEAEERAIRAALEPIAARHGLRLEFTFSCVREGCRIAEDHPLVHSLRAAYQAETGRPLPVTGTRLVADAAIFEKTGGIPCLYHGPYGEGAHGDVERVSETELLQAARVYLRTAAAYLGAGPGRSGPPPAV